MRKTIFIFILAITSIYSHSQTRSPTDNEFSASYCLGRALSIQLNLTDSDEFTKSLAAKNSEKIKRLQAYIFSRLADVDQLAMLYAKNQGGKDFTESKIYIGACFSESQDKVTECLAGDPHYAKNMMCSKLDFLPF